jgi:hypothetical protein
VIRYLVALGLTLLVEGGVVAALAPASLRRRALLASLWINLFTHPLATLFFRGTRLSFGMVESVVIVVETLLYADLLRCRLGRAAALSLAANVASLLLSRLFD